MQFCFRTLSTAATTAFVIACPATATGTCKTRVIWLDGKNCGVTHASVCYTGMCVHTVHAAAEDIPPAPPPTVAIFPGPSTALDAMLLKRTHQRFTIKLNIEKHLTSEVRHGTRLNHSQVLQANNNQCLTGVLNARLALSHGTSVVRATGDSMATRKMHAAIFSPFFRSFVLSFFLVVCML